MQAVLDIAFSDGAAQVLKKPGNGGSNRGVGVARGGAGGGGEGAGRSTREGGGAARANRPASARRYR